MNARSNSYLLYEWLYLFALSEPSSILPSCSAWHSVQKSPHICWSWSFALWYDGRIYFQQRFICSLTLTSLFHRLAQQPQSFSLFLHSGRFEELPLQLLGCRLWNSWCFDPPEDGVRHCFRTPASSQTQCDSQVRYTDLSLVAVNLILPFWKGSFHPNGVCALFWSLPATTSWCCLSVWAKLQHQWFCCRGASPFCSPSLPCGGDWGKETLTAILENLKMGRRWCYT